MIEITKTSYIFTKKLPFLNNKVASDLILVYSQVHIAVKDKEF